MSFEVGHHLDDIDIGIGIMPYWEFHHLDAAVIAPNREEARDLFALHLCHHHHPFLPPELSVLQILQHLENDSDGTAYFEILLYETVPMPPQVLFRNTEHWICQAIQHDRRVPMLARYWAWREDKPLWYLAGSSNIQEISGRSAV
jgi:hypothetical protein